MEKKINDLKRVLQQFSLIAQQLLAENNSLKQACSNQQSEIEQLRQSYLGSERNLGILRGKYDSLVEECDSLRDKAEQKEQVKKKKEALVSENADLKSKVEKLQDKVKELEAELKRRDSDFYTTVSAMLQSIQERCYNNGTVVASIESQISGSFSMQTQERFSEAIEKSQDNESLDSGMSNSSTDDSTDPDCEQSANPTNDDTSESSEHADENNASNNGGFNFGGDF